MGGLGGFPPGWIAWVALRDPSLPRWGVWGASAPPGQVFATLVCRTLHAAVRRSFPASDGCPDRSALSEQLVNTWNKDVKLISRSGLHLPPSVCRYAALGPGPLGPLLSVVEVVSVVSVGRFCRSVSRSPPNQDSSFIRICLPKRFVSAATPPVAVNSPNSSSLSMFTPNFSRLSWICMPALPTRCNIAVRGAMPFAVNLAIISPVSISLDNH